MATSKPKAAAISVVSNTLLILMKLIAGFITGSVSLIAEAIHSIMDLVASVVAFVSVSVADRPADDKHQFGHGKAENISGVIEGLLILIAAGLIVNEAIHKIITGVRLEIIDVGIGVMGVAIVVNVLVSRYLRKTAATTDSLALEADATHLTTDVITMAGVFTGLIAVRITGLTIIDPIVAMLVALLIVKAAVDIIRKSMSGLMDASLPEQEKAVIESCLREHDRYVVGFHRLRTRKAGSQREVDVHLVISATARLDKAHQLCDHLETDIANLLRNTHVNIHIEPCDSQCEQCRVDCETQAEKKL